MVRAFVAVELSEDVRDRLGEAQECLRSCGAHLTFVRPDYIHVTMKFLGEVEEKDLPNVIAALKTVSFAPFTVNAGTVTVDNPKRPHTVWCAIEDSGESRNLFRSIEDVLGPLGFARETRRFTPHATVARVRRPDQSLFTALDKLKSRTYGSCIIAGFRLKKSTLTPQGPIYEDLPEVP
jgi:RNA 2',3'-cyclic 3'-phosphodiesterase